MFYCLGDKWIVNFIWRKRLEIVCLEGRVIFIFKSEIIILEGFEKIIEMFFGVR